MAGETLSIRIAMDLSPTYWISLIRECLGWLCPSLPLTLLLPPFLWASSLLSLLAGGCILGPPPDLWPDLEYPFHNDLRKQR